MKNPWSAIKGPFDSIGHPTKATLGHPTYAPVEVQGSNESVWALIEHLRAPSSVDRSKEPVGTRFVLVDPDGHYMALALEFPPGSEITLAEVESVERFASDKVGRSMVALRWDLIKIPPAVERAPVAIGAGERPAIEPTEDPHPESCLRDVPPPATPPVITPGPENPVALRGPATDAPPNSFGGPRRIH